MSDQLVLLGLPEEILTMIIREHFVDAKIIIYPSISENERRKRRPRAKMHYRLKIFFVCKKFYQLAVPTFLRNATFHHEGRRVSLYRNFWNEHRLGFPSEQLRKISGDVEFAVHLNETWASSDFPYLNIRQITVKDILYEEVDAIPYVLTELKNLRVKAKRASVTVKCYLIVTMIEYDHWLGDSADTMRIIVNEDGSLELYERTDMIRAAVVDITTMFEEAFGCRLLVHSRSERQQWEEEWRWKGPPRCRL